MQLDIYFITMGSYMLMKYFGMNIYIYKSIKIHYANMLK